MDTTEKKRRYIKAIRAVYMLFGIVGLASILLIKSNPELAQGQEIAYEALPFAMAYSLLMVATGLYLAQYKTWAWYAAIGISAFGLLGFPFLTIIHGLILYVLVASKDLFLNKSDPGARA